jgi:hypothetical protein
MTAIIRQNMPAVTVNLLLRIKAMAMCVLRKAHIRRFEEAYDDSKNRVFFESAI